RRGELRESGLYRLRILEAQVLQGSQDLMQSEWFLELLRGLQQSVNAAVTPPNCHHGCGFRHSERIGWRGGEGLCVTSSLALTSLHELTCLLESTQPYFAPIALRHDLALF